MEWVYPRERTAQGNGNLKKKVKFGPSLILFSNFFHGLKQILEEILWVIILEG